MMRHATPVVLLLVTMLLARQLYPYVSGNEPTVVEGYEVERVASKLGGPTCLVVRRLGAAMRQQARRQFTFAST